MKRNGARPKKSPLKHRPKDPDGHMVRMIDELAEFEEFRTTLLPAIRRDLQAGMPAEEMRKKYRSLVQARQIMTAITAEDGTALAAARDILDRADGKATEKKEIVHRYADMKDEELEAILKSEEEDLKHLMEHTEQGH